MSDAESKTRIETAALIRDYLEAFNAGDTEGMIEFLTDEVIHDVNQGERRTGKDKFRAFNARMTTITASASTASRSWCARTGHARPPSST